MRRASSGRTISAIRTSTCRQFFGNLYHLNAEEEPEGYYYPKDPEFKKKYGPLGVIHSYADGRIEDTGPLSVARMPTIDQPGWRGEVHQQCGEAEQAVLRVVQHDAMTD